jgi:beta-alanine--pyruvate transaminase
MQETSGLRSIDAVTGVLGNDAEVRRLTELVGHTMVDFNQMSVFAEDPLILTEGDGVWVTDVLGRRYLDAMSGVYTLSLGHSATEVIEAIYAQLQKLPFSSPVVAINDTALRLVGLLREIAGGRLDHVKLFTTGSEAIEAAFRLARQHHKQSGQPGKYKVVSFYKGFHGATLGALSATGWPKMRVPYEPLAGGFIHARPPICGRPDEEHDHGACVAAATDELRELILHEGPETVAALILEPVMASAGVHPLSADFLGAVRAVCDELDIVLIYDEIVTGMGRVGTWFGAERVDVWPDILCLGKGVSAGYAPLSAVLMNERIAGSFWGTESAGVHFQAGHTYGGNPVGAAAGIATIGVIREQGVLENVRSAGAQLGARLAALRDTSDRVREVRGVGLIWGLQLDGGSNDASDGWRIGEAVQAAGRARGLLVRAGPHGVTIAPPLVTKPDEIDEMAQRLEDAIAAASYGT